MKQTVDRKHGYLAALRERGFAIRKELVKCGNVSFNSGLSDTLELLNMPEPPDAILAGHGLLTISAFQAVISKGIRVPDDLTFIGFMSDWVLLRRMKHLRAAGFLRNIRMNTRLFCR